MILAHAEFWAHSTTATPEREPVRAFGPFTWGWGRGGEDRIDYLNVWCPAGPGYAHRWRRWGESRRDDGFLLRSGGIGLLEGGDGEGEGEGERNQCDTRYCQKSHLIRSSLSLLRKGKAAGLRTVRYCWQKRKKKSVKDPTNEMSSPSSSRAAAVRKIVFETWSHQDYFGAVGDSFPSAATAAEEAHHFAPRVFCDVSINRKKTDAGSSSVRWWKKRRWWGQCSGGVVADNTHHKNDDDDDDDGKNNNNNEKNSDSRHGKLVSYKPFVLETGETPRCYYPRYHINVWRWDDDDDDDDNNTIRMNTTMPSNDHNYKFPTPREFLRQLEVGDTIGVWGRVGKGETYHIIDAMRMHVFWAL